jgi:hypothetical protein
MGALEGAHRDEQDAGSVAGFGWNGRMGQEIRMGRPRPGGQMVSREMEDRLRRAWEEAEAGRRRIQRDYR